MLIMRSMTGFGSSSTESPGFECKVEIKSVNHRYLNIIVRTPKDFFSLEEKIRQKISKYLERGRVEVRVDIKFMEEEYVEPKFNAQVADKYLDGLKELKEITGEKDVSILQVLAKMPEVFSLEKMDIDEGDYWPVIEKAVTEATRELIEMKELEGQAMKNDIFSRKEVLEGLISEVKEMSPRVEKQIKERFMSRLEGLIREGNIEKDRVVGEAALLAEKAAIDEELVRLESHINQLEEIINKEEFIGRKLDFLLQEINREINTVASKADDEGISKKVLEIKSQVEKIREQTQNIE